MERHDQVYSPGDNRLVSDDKARLIAELCSTVKAKEANRRRGRWAALLRKRSDI